ncbi:MAG: hypothetical protein ACLGHJ_09685 [Gammaproteobacteria bacterium]
MASGTSGKPGKTGSTGTSGKLAFLHDHGHGAARLAAVTARFDWSQPDALPRAREALALFVDTVVELLRAEARARRRTPGALLGELAAASRDDELPLLWLALCRLEQHAGEPLKGLPPARRQLLEDAAARLASHWRLLRDGTLPASRLGDISTIDTDTLLARLLQQAIADGTIGRAATLARLLKTAAHDGDKPRAVVARLRKLRQQLESVPGAGIRLDYPTFRALPSALRRTLLFTPGLAAAFLDETAQSAARPPSPDFDPLYFDRALADLAAGRLDHLDIDTLVLGADASPVFRARIVQSLANGVGSLECADDVRERLIAASEVPEICLVACAVARHRDDMRRALAQPKQLPHDGVLGEALARFAQIVRAADLDNPEHDIPGIPA